MHLYLRIIREHGPEGDFTTEEQRLRDCLNSAPGIGAVKEVTKHQRGGYGVSLEQTGDAIGQLDDYLASFGYRAVI